MMFEDAAVHQSLQRIVLRLTADSALHDDLMQECLIRLWSLERQEPGRTRSWYLQNCRFHLQHHLASGRSLDSPKRAVGDKRIAIDGAHDALAEHGYDTNGELFELVCARDVVSALTRRLKPCESAVLAGLADGHTLRDIAGRLELSYPTALKYRRKIAALAVKLGISSPLIPPPGRPIQSVHRPPVHREVCSPDAGSCSAVPADHPPRGASVDTIPNARSATAPLANVGAPPRVVAAALQRAKRTGSRYFNRRSTQSKILIYPGSSPGPPLCLRIQTAR